MIALHDNTIPYFSFPFDSGFAGEAVGLGVAVVTGLGVVAGVCVVAAGVATLLAGFVSGSELQAAKASDIVSTNKILLSIVMSSRSEFSKAKNRGFHQVHWRMVIRGEVLRQLSNFFYGLRLRHEADTAKIAFGISRHSGSTLICNANWKFAINGWHSTRTQTDSLRYKSLNHGTTGIRKLTGCATTLW